MLVRACAAAPALPSSLHLAWKARLARGTRHADEQSAADAAYLDIRAREMATEMASEDSPSRSCVWARG